MRLLLAEDDPKLLKSLKHIFETNKFSVDVVNNGEDALHYALSDEYDGLVLDIMMPGLDGIEVLKRLRKENVTTPALFLTARTEVSQRVEGLDAGADDYVTKPFGMMELISRIKAVLRRSAKGSVSSEDTFEIGEIRLDPKKHEVTVHGEVVNLTLKEYELLKRLMKNSNIVLTRDQLLEDIWGYDFDGETRTVDVHVRTLRQKLGDAGEQIETVRGVGYRMSR